MTGKAKAQSGHHGSPVSGSLSAEKTTTSFCTSDTSVAETVSLKFVGLHSGTTASAFFSLNSPA